MIQLTPTAITKVHEILESQDPKPAGLRIAVVGGGCSGFSYSMAFETNPGMLDKTYNFEGLKVSSIRPASFTWTAPRSIMSRRWRDPALSSTIQT